MSAPTETGGGLNVVILAAGRGTRLGQPFPKPLTPLHDGRSIMQQQIENIREVFGANARVMTVVGFKLRKIIKAFPDVTYVYNPEFKETNTSKSLLRALEGQPPGGVLWLNGDVVFDPTLLRRLEPYLASETSVLAVNTASVAEEEVKYRVGPDGCVTELSKQVSDALGEAVGINYVSAQDRAALVNRLRQVDDSDYFERGIELAIQHDDVRFRPVDISDLYAVEVDFPEDLERANVECRSSLR